MASVPRLLTFVLLVSLLSGCEVLAQSWETDSTAAKLEPLKMTLPILNMPIEIPREYSKLIVFIGVFVILLYYVPNGYIAIRDSLGQLKSRRSLFEMEKMKYEVLKLKYEIEALKKIHQIPQIEPGEKLEKKVEKIESAQPYHLTGQLGDVLPLTGNVDTHEKFFWRRLLAVFVDYFVLILLLGILMFVIPSISLAENNGLMLMLTYVPFSIYFILMWTFYGATIGKLVAGLRIVTLDGRHLSLGTSTIRLAIMALSNIIGFAWLLWDKQDQTLYDKAAKTRVIRVRRGHQKNAT